MGRAKVYTVIRPEGGAERDAYWLRHHDCGPGALMRRANPDGHEDLLLFPYGLVGEGMPIGEPFEVGATETCGACGNFVRAIFVWQGAQVFVDFGARPKDSNAE